MKLGLKFCEQNPAMNYQMRIPQYLIFFDRNITRENSQRINLVMISVTIVSYFWYFNYIFIRVTSNYFFKFKFGDAIWGLVGLFRCLLQKTCSVRHSCVCAVASGYKLHSAVQQGKLVHIGLGRMVP